MFKNTGYLVTFSKSPDTAPFDKIGPFRREEKGNKVTAILHTYFIPRKSLKPKGKDLGTRQI
jgi:hypothetical protein